MTTVRRFVRLTGAANVAEMRTMTFEGAEHLVVPVIALIGNAVVRPMHSTGPEFVPAEELSLAPGGWDGRPVMPDHPENGTGSANEPRTLEQHRFGQLFGTRYESGRLKTEAWLDVARAERIGGEAMAVIERCRAGEAVEVSVGCWVALEQVAGVSPGGDPYEFRWSAITPDHLAMLPRGVEGACSVEMGCGAPRSARAEPEINERRAAMRAAGRQERPMNLMHRILSSLGFRGSANDAGQSNVDLEGALWSAIYAAEPAVQWIADVFQESQTFIYVTAPGDAPAWYRRSYSVADDGTVALADDAEQVEPMTRYEPLAAGEPKSTDHPATARAACGCQTPGEGQAAPATDESESKMSTKITDLVGRLIANATSPFTDDDKAHLEALGEAKLEALDATFGAEPETKADPEKPEAVAEAVTPEEPDDSVKISAEELADLRAAASAHKRAAGGREGRAARPAQGQAGRLHRRRAVGHERRAAGEGRQAREGRRRARARLLRSRAARDRRHQRVGLRSA